MADHILCCDCDRCLNGSGGYTLPGAGRLVGPHVTPPPRAQQGDRYALRVAYCGALTSLLERRSQAATRLTDG